MTEVPAEVGGAETELVAEEPVEPVMPTLVPPFSVVGLTVVDAHGTLVASAGAAHHSVANAMAVANLIAEALNK